MKSAALRDRAKRTRSPSANELIFGASHRDTIFAARFKLLTQGERKGENNVLFEFSAGPFRAVVDASVSGIDNDKRARVAIDFRRRFARPSRCGLGRTICQRDVAHEAIAIGRDEIEHQTRRLTFGRVEHERLFKTHRSFCIEHDAGAALHDQAVAKRLHQAARLLARFGGKLESGLRQIDHHAIRIGEREGGDVDLPAEIDDEARLLVVSADPDIGGDGQRFC